MTSVLYDAPGPRARRRILIGSLIAAAALLAVTVLVAIQLYDQDQFEGDRWRPMFDPRHEQFQDLWTFLGGGLSKTGQAAALAMVFSLVLGTLFAVLRIHAMQTSPRRPAAARPGPLQRAGRQVGVRGYRWTVVGALEILRGLPVVIAVVYVDRVAPEAGIDLPKLWYLVIGLTAYNSVVIGEIVRAGVQALPKGQAEAAQALGLTRWQTLRLVLLPQSFRIMLPALISQLVVVLKDTSLGFFIAYEELVRRGNIAKETLGNPLQLLLVIGAIYVIVNYALSRLAVYTERRLSRTSAPGHAAAQDIAPVDVT